MTRNLVNISTLYNGQDASYIQFYIVDDNSKQKSEALLISDKINVTSYSNKEIALSSYNGQGKIEKAEIDNNGTQVSKEYYLKAEIFCLYNTYSNNYHRIYSNATPIYDLPAPQYGSIEIANLSNTNNKTFSTSNGIKSLNGKYNITTVNNEEHFQLTMNGDETFDFII